MALCTLLGSSDLILSSQRVSWKHTALGVGIQMFSIIQDQALKLRHIFHCASTGGFLLSAALFKHACYFRLRQQFRPSKSLLSFEPGRVLACSFWSDHRKYVSTLALTQRCFIHSLAPLGIPVMFKILRKWWSSPDKIPTFRLRSDGN